MCYSIQTQTFSPTKHRLSETVKKNRVRCSFSAMQGSAVNDRGAEIRITEPAPNSMDPAAC